MSEKTARVTLAGLRVLVAVAEAGSFSEAAAELGMSQSTLSEAVATLERALGQPLLRRSHGGVQPTPAGERALEHARYALLAVSDLHLAVLEEHSLSGTLNIAAFRSIGMHLLPPALARLRRDHPGLQVRVLDAEADGSGGQQLIMRGEVDAGLIGLPADQPLLIWPLMHDDYLAVFPTSRGIRPVSWAELAAQPLILPPYHDSCHRRVMGHFRAHGVGLPTITEVGEDDVILSMVEHGLGITVQPRLAVTPLRPGLVALPLPAPLTRELGVAVRPGRAGLPHIRAFVEAVRAQAATFVTPGVAAPL